MGLNGAPGARARLHHWWDARHPRSDTLTLTQRNVYILPTGAGLMFALTLVVLLLASINYQLGLGYALTFLLAGCGFASMHITHATLRGLTLHLRAPAPVFAGEAAALDVVVGAPGARTRWGIGLRAGEAGAWSWIDVPAGGQGGAQLSFVPPQRGRHPMPTLHVETRFPLGLFRAWTVWRPAATVLAYPRPESPAAALPAARPVAGHSSGARRSGGGETEGVRAWRRGDPLNQIVWKKSVRALDSSGELVSRDTSVSAHQELWLDYHHTGATGVEQRLSRLAAWVVAAERAGIDYGIRLPGLEWPPDHGGAHRRNTLEALALWT